MSHASDRTAPPAARPRRDAGAPDGVTGLGAAAVGSAAVQPSAAEPAIADPAAMDARVRRALRRLEEVLRDGAPAPTLAELGRAVGASGSWLQRRFRAELGVSPADWVTAHRAAAARAALRAGADVASAADVAGFGSLPRAQAVLTAALGMPPGRYRRGGAGETLTYATVTGPLGVIRLAASARGICWLALGDDAEALTVAMTAEWPAARFVFVSDSKDLMIASWLDDASRMALALCDGNARDDAARDLPFPLDLRGTAFRLKVWDALRRLRRGEVVDYGELAARIGSPRAVRAVGTACGANPVALLVPCHRVLRRDGALGGYRWGTDRKLALLRAESAAESSPAP